MCGQFAHFVGLEKFVNSVSLNSQKAKLYLDLGLDLVMECSFFCLKSGEKSIFIKVRHPQKFKISVLYQAVC